MPINDYQEINYKNGASGGTPLNASNLEHNDDQVNLLTDILRGMEQALGTGDIIDMLHTLATTPTFSYIDMVNGVAAAHQIGRMYYHSDDDTINLCHANNVIQQIGEELYARTINLTGATIPNGSVIGYVGTTGESIGLYIADGSLPPSWVYGLATQDIDNESKGRITTFGRVRGLNTSGFSYRQPVWASPTIPGGLTNIKPTAPHLAIQIGVVTKVGVSDGEIFVRPIIEQQLYYGSFARTTDLTPALTNTPYAIEFNATNISNGVTIGAIPSRIIVQHSGYYEFDVSFQLSSSNSSAKKVYMWFRKNGVDVPNTLLVRSLESSSAIAVQSRSIDLSLNAGDYIELIWAADSTAVMLDARAPIGFVAPSAPSVFLTVDQVQQ